MFSLSKLRKALSAFALCCLGVMGIAPLALADDPATHFELDGNMTGGNSTKPDWTNIFTGKLPGAGVTYNALPAGFSAQLFRADFNPTGNNDDSLFATGSKDTLNITPGWQCKRTNNVNDKTDINNAFAVAAVKTGADNKPHLFVYFALDVASNEGTKDVGFWFLKDPSVSCPSGGGSTPFVGSHTDGDVLIVSEFTSGGRVSEIKAYKWVGGANGYLDSNPVAVGAECGSGSGNVCARVNDVVLNGSGTGNGDQVPWLVKTKTSNPNPGYDSPTDLDLGMFFEGGIDLTAAGISGCFNRYLADTRSSTSLGATIFDFVIGDFASCSIKASKSCETTVVNTADNNYTSTFKVTITNDSATGTVHDVSFNEAANAIPSGETCKILANSNTGDQNVDNVPLTNGGTPVKLTSSLAAGADVSVEITCTGSANGFQNAVNVLAGSSSGLSDISKSGVQSDTCSATVNSGLQITKQCTGLNIVPSSVASDPIQLLASVAVTVTNPASILVNNVPVPVNESVVIDSVTDSKVGALGSQVIGHLTQVLCDSSTPPKPASPVTAANDLNLSPGETACFIGSYTPTNGDLNGQTDPSTTFFTDQATAKAHGALSTKAFEEKSSVVSCFLCDDDVDSFADVNDKYPTDPNQH
ncbi:hypothetical protein PQU96_12480 [Vogesella sp. LYT5W]|uniref:DUF11 domain-containing protein n=1 Tax=Vogesella margarita TaxID=2984199 RepID=A0ABT5IQS3_9NEIS|nr:hypothetical protein [Vogesella margarita]MDC7714929.1 hypothetical protein [Vogesella margarita]